MDSLTSFHNGFHDIRTEKANAISRYRRVQRITTLFRIVEFLVFLIVVSRFSTKFSFSLKLSIEQFKGISMTLISPRFVFLLGNAIVAALFLISGQFPGKSGEKKTDLHDDYVEKCRKNQEICLKEEKKETHVYKHSFSFDERKIYRSPSENLEKRVHVAAGDERRRELRRCVTENGRRNVDCSRKMVGGGNCSYNEDKMSSEEFRRTVEAFIERQQRFLREEEDFSAVVVSV